jgi:hypothetical protein
LARSRMGALARAGARWRALVHAAFARGADAALVRAGLGRGEGWESEGDWAWGRGAGGLGRADGEGREGESGGGGAAQRLLLSKRCAGAPHPAHARTRCLSTRTAHACTGV